MSNPQPLSQLSISSSSSSSSSAPSQSTDSITNDSELQELPLMDEDDEFNPPYRLIRAETILRYRTNRFILVLESLQDPINHQTIVRTADSMGVQYLYIIGDHQKQSKQHVRTGTLSMAAGRWLTIKYFATSQECVEHLRHQNAHIWVTSLAPGTVMLEKKNFVDPLPQHVAIVMGREVDGVSPYMIQQADKIIALQMYGFSESFNVGVATALVIQKIFDIWPNARGELSEQEKDKIRKGWYSQLSPNGDALSVKDYVDKWYPQGTAISEYSKAIEEEHGIFACMRPKEENRIPRVSKKVRMKMEAQGCRVVDVSKQI